MEKELPIGWVETELHVVSEILDNLRKPINSTERGGRIGNIPYYGATGQAGWIDDYLFDEELVLVGEDGAPFFDKTKNVAYLVNGKSWVNNHAHVLKAISKISSNKFLLHFLNQFDYKDFVGGTTRLKLTQGDLKIIPVPLPPLPEQQRIVAKLDTLFGHLDALKTRLDRIPQLLKDFRQKVLTRL
jgi:type I restriction enzyme S subunit